MSSQSDNIKVCIRVRPLNSQESQNDPKSYIQTIPNQPSCLIVDQKDNKAEPKIFSFDWVAGESSTQQDIFELIGKPMVDRCLEGYNCCIFAYGQTGTGKTYTMQGRGLENNSNESLHRGLQPRIIDHIFELKEKEEAENPDVQYEIKCSYLEIYNEQVMDLFNPNSKHLNIRQDAREVVYIEDLEELDCSNAEETLSFLQQGTYNRHVGSTNMNQESSRSHSLFIMSIYKRTPMNVFTSKFNFVDLAGSERQKQTNAKGSLFKEANSINKSLSALGKVINSLAEGKNRHISYRDSKLTHILKDSLGGNSATFLIANVSPASSSLAETLSTLGFAHRAKLIKNKPSVNHEELSLYRSQSLSNLPPEFYALKQEAQSSDIQVLSTLKREHQSQSHVCELGETTMQKLIELLNPRRADHDAVLQAEIAELRKLKLEYQNERKNIIEEINAAPQKNNDIPQEDKEIQVIDLEEPAPNPEKLFITPNEMISQFQEMMSKIEAQAEKQISQPKNEIEEAVRALREEYSNRITALESDLLQQRLIACDKSAEVVNAEIRHKNLEKKLDMQIQSSLDQKNLWEKSRQEYEKYWSQEVEQKNQELNGLLKKNAEIALDLQIKSNDIKRLQGFREKYMELERGSRAQNQRKDQEICQYQKKLENYTERLLQKNLETQNLKKQLYYLTQNLQQKIKDIKELQRSKQVHAKREADLQRDDILKNSMETMIIKYREIVKAKTNEISQKNLQLSELRSAWNKLDMENHEKVDYKAELEEVKEKYEKLEKSSQKTRTRLENKLKRYEESWKGLIENKRKKKLEILNLTKENNQLSLDLKHKSDESQEWSKKHDKTIKKKKAYKKNCKELKSKVESLEESQKTDQFKTEFLTEVSKNTLKMFGKFEEWIFSTLLLKAPISQRYRIDTLQSLFTSFKGKMGGFITGSESSLEVPENFQLAHLQESLSRKEEFENAFEKFTQEFDDQLQSLQQSALLHTPSIDPSDQVSIPSNDYVSECEQDFEPQVEPSNSSVNKETEISCKEEFFEKVTLPSKLAQLRNSKPQDSPWATFISPFDNKENECGQFLSSPGFIRAARVFGSPIDPQILNGKRSYEEMRSGKTPEKMNQEQRSFGLTIRDSLNITEYFSTSSGKRKVGASSGGSELKKKLKVD